MKGRRLISFVLLAFFSLSCGKDWLDLTLSTGLIGSDPDRKVMLLYEAGFNSLSGDISFNIETLRDGYLPGNAWDDDVLLVFSHLKGKSGGYLEETEPVLFRLYASRGATVVDTLKTWPAGTPVANAAMVTEVFNWVREEFPAKGYGAVMSSHATGWLPEGYFSNPKKYEGGGRSSSVWASAPYRTFGQEYFSSGKKTEEIELKDDDIAIVHDGIRPMVDSSVLSDILRVCRLHGNGVTSTPYNEQIFRIQDEFSTREYIPRETLRKVATPQAYEYGLLLRSYRRAFEEKIGIYGSAYTNTMMV